MDFLAVARSYRNKQHKGSLKSNSLETNIGIKTARH